MVTKTKENIKLTPTGIVLPKDLPISEWIETWEKIKNLRRSLQWVMGDLLNYGEKLYGERHWQVLDPNEWDYEYIRQLKYTAKHIPPEKRRAHLRFTYHQIVASLPPKQQEYWLAQAEKGMSVSELRKNIKRRKK